MQTGSSETLIDWKSGKNHLCSSIGPNGGIAAMDSGSEPIAWEIPVIHGRFFVKDIMRIIEWLREIKTVDQHCYKFLLTYRAKYFFTQCKLIISNVEIIACKLHLFKNPNNWFHKSRDQRRKGEINCNCVCAINRQNYGPCQYGTLSLNSSPGFIKPENHLTLLSF